MEKEERGPRQTLNNQTKAGIFQVDRDIEAFLREEQEFTKLKEQTKKISKRVITQAKVAFKCQDLQQQIEILKKQISDNDIAIAELKARIIGNRSEIKNDRECQDAAVYVVDKGQNVQDKLSQLQNEIDKYKSLVGEKEQWISTLVFQNSQKDIQIAELQRNVQIQAKKNKQIIQQRQNTIDKLLNQAEVLRTQSNSKQNLISSLENQIQALRTQMNQKDATINLQNTAAATLQQQLQNIRERLNRKTQALRTSQFKLKSLNDRYPGLQEQHRAKIQQNISLSEQNLRLANRYNEQVEQTNRYLKELEELYKSQ